MPLPSKDFIMTGYTIGSIERNIISPMASMLETDIKVDAYNRFDLGPHKINCFGSDNAKSFQAMQGMTSYGWYANEITIHHPNTINEAFERCSGEGTRIFWDTNPEGPAHPVKLNFIDKSGLRDEAGNLLVQSFHFQLEDNIFLPPEYITNVKRVTPPGMWYDRRILGLWVIAEGVIFNNWEIVDEIPDDVKSSSRRFMGVDFGFTVDPAVAVDVYFHGESEIWVDELIYSVGYNNQVFAIELEKVYEYGLPIYADSAEPKSIDEIGAYGFNIYGATKGPDSVRVGIDWLASKKIYITMRSKNIINEFQNYSWRTDKDGKQLPVPIDAYNHGIDAIRYSASELIDTYRGRIGEFSAADIGL